MSLKLEDYLWVVVNWHKKWKNNGVIYVVDEFYFENQLYRMLVIKNKNCGIFRKTDGHCQTGEYYPFQKALLEYLL